MTLYNYRQLEQLWEEAGGSPVLAPLMAAIALAESGQPCGNTVCANSEALNLTDNNGTQTSVGLWQVSNGTHEYPAEWRTPIGNAREAVNKLETQGITAWGTYTSGAYKQFYKPGSVPPGGTYVSGQNTGGGGLGGFIDTIAKALNFSFWSQGVPDVKASTSSVAQAISSVALPLVKLAEALDWFFHPAHWIRLLAGIGGGALVLGGVWQMSHAGGE